MLDRVPDVAAGPCLKSGIYVTRRYRLLARNATALPTRPVTVTWNPVTSRPFALAIAALAFARTATEVPTPPKVDACKSTDGGRVRRFLAMRQAGRGMTLGAESAYAIEAFGLVVVCLRPIATIPSRAAVQCPGATKSPFQQPPPRQDAAVCAGIERLAVPIHLGDVAFGREPAIGALGVQAVDAPDEVVAADREGAAPRVATKAVVGTSAVRQRSPCTVRHAGEARVARLRADGGKGTGRCRHR